MRSNGKIYVVVTVLVIILIGLFLYLINTRQKDQPNGKKYKVSMIQHILYINNDIWLPDMNINFLKL